MPSREDPKTLKRRIANDKNDITPEDLTVLEEARPKTRAECQPGGPKCIRPCPFASCVYNLWLDVSPTSGSIRYTNNDDENPPEQSCALDLIDDEHLLRLEDVGAALNTTRENIRVIEKSAIAKIRESLKIPEDQIGDATATGKNLKAFDLELRRRRYGTMREYLKTHPGADTKEIKQGSGVPPSAVSGVLSYMEQHGEVRREQLGRKPSKWFLK